MDLLTDGAAASIGIEDLVDGLLLLFGAAAIFAVVAYNRIATTRAVGSECSDLAKALVCAIAQLACVV